MINKDNFKKGQIGIGTLVVFLALAVVSIVLLSLVLGAILHVLFGVQFGLVLVAGSVIGALIIGMFIKAGMRETRKLQPTEEEIEEAKREANKEE